MKQELELRLQAYVDGELSASEAGEMKARIESDAEARGLYEEMRQTSMLLRANEIERRLPESREFYWSKIEREITRLEAEPAEETAPWWIAALRRHLGAVSGLGVAALLMIVAAFQLNWVSSDLFEEIDNPLDESASSFSFRSESQKMTVVWIANPAANNTAEDEPDPGVETLQ